MFVGGWRICYVSFLKKNEIIFGQNVRNKYLVREKQWSQKRSLGKRSESCAKISDKKRKFEVRNHVFALLIVISQLCIGGSYYLSSILASLD